MPEAKNIKKKKVWETPTINKIGLSQTASGPSPVFSERFNTATFPNGTNQFAQS